MSLLCINKLTSIIVLLATCCRQAKPMSLPSRAQRPYDLVLVGSTGFTGKLASNYLALRLVDWSSPPITWAITGRSLSNLHALRSELLAAVPSAPPPDIIVADLERDGADTLKEKIASQTKVVLSTAGPFAKYGNDLVAACVTAGTDYCDITGEVDWVRGLIRKHDAAAKQSGARIVPFCGHDSVPWDLLTLAVATRLGADDDGVLRTQSTSKTQEGTLEDKRLGGTRKGEALSRISFEDDIQATASGGSIATIYHAVSHSTNALDGDSVQDDDTRGADPLTWTSPKEQGGASIAPETVSALPLLPRWSRKARGGQGSWTGPFLMATVNAEAVKRSNALLSYSTPVSSSSLSPSSALLSTSAPTSSPSSPLIYEECKLHGSFFSAASDLASLALFALSFKVSPLRALLKATVLPAPGQGPSAQEMARGYLRVKAVGVGATTGALVEAQLSFEDDPGYRETARMLCEAALCLLEDRRQGPDLEAQEAIIEGGLLTPASCMGLRLLSRLCETGCCFSISDPVAP